jgi:hypothetical protein
VQRSHLFDFNHDTLLTMDGRWLHYFLRDSSDKIADLLGLRHIALPRKYIRIYSTLRDWLSNLSTITVEGEERCPIPLESVSQIGKKNALLSTVVEIHNPIYFGIPRNEHS